MSYRSFKRVLGETNLERKCLLLFAATLFPLICAAFWYAERNAEELVHAKTQQMGYGYVRLALMQYHLYEHFAKPDSTPQSDIDMLVQMDKELAMKDYEWEILVPEGGATIEKTQRKTRFMRSERERVIAADLQRRLEQQVGQFPLDEETDERLEVQPVPANPAVPSANAPPGSSPTTSPPDAESFDSGIAPFEPVAHLEQRRSKNFFYQPVYWQETCITCHRSTEGAQGFLSRKQEPHAELRGPLRVIKVTLPSDESQFAIDRSRAILLTTAIITVFLSVLFLYLVVRYVIVKPLNHLRDVSDEISRGNTALRADIQTNDEFEDLAASFNRMLRHLTDTQEELRKVNSDLDGKLDQLAEANMQLHEMNRLKSDFLANMSHELRTPLNSIIGFSDVLKGISALNDKQQRYVDNIAKSGRVLLEMINDILDLAKMESGKMGLRLTEFALAPVVQAQCDLVRALTEEKNIDLDVQVQSDLPTMLQDQGKVQQILTNLLSNAIKFTPEGGRITVSAIRASSGDLLLTVEDTGVGIAEEDRHIIFEKFRQGTTVLGEDNLTRKFSGTGLGLSIVKELCRLLGGDISFESELGKGSSFTARLPWQGRENPRIESSLATRLEEVAKTQRVEGLRGHLRTSGADDDSRALSSSES